jgi:hypothetical protein
MSVVAPLRVPVEIRRGAPRWFRMAHGVSEEGLLFPRALPEEADGPLQVTFQLPGDPLPVACAARALELPPDEAAGQPERGSDLRRAVRFVGLGAEDRARIARYVEERVPA